MEVEDLFPAHGGASAVASTALSPSAQGSKEGQPLAERLGESSGECCEQAGKADMRPSKLEEFATIAGVEIVDIGKETFEGLCPSVHESRAERSTTHSREPQMPHAEPPPVQRPDVPHVHSPSETVTKFLAKRCGDKCGDCRSTKIFTNCEFCWKKAMPTLCLRC